MVVRIGELVGNGAAVWPNMQEAHDFWHAMRKVDTSIIPTLKNRA